MSFSPLQSSILSTLRQATTAARVRTGDKDIAVAVEAGCYQVQRVTQRAGLPALVRPLSPWGSFVEALDKLARLH